MAYPTFSLLVVCFPKLKVSLHLLYGNYINKVDQTSPHVEPAPKISDPIPQYLNDLGEETASFAAATSRTTGSHPLPTHLHRAPVLATTFNGKTIYMKRKTRIDRLLRKVRVPLSFQSISIRTLVRFWLQNRIRI